MFEWLFLLPQDMSSQVAVNAAYTLHTAAIPTPEAKCCGMCKHGRIVHGDGHATECPCPPGCKCKVKSVLVPSSKVCIDCKPAK